MPHDVPLITTIAVAFGLAFILAFIASAVDSRCWSATCWLGGLGLAYGLLPAEGVNLILAGALQGGLDCRRGAPCARPGGAVRCRRRSCSRR